MANEDSFGKSLKVRLQSTVKPDEKIIFTVTPNVSETIQIGYQSIQPVHFPGAIQLYQHTSAKTYNISQIQLISRTPQEAAVNLFTLNILRGWTKPYFGATVGNMLGASPDVLYFWAYSNSPSTKTSGNTKSHVGNINRIPVVLTSLNINYPNDVDYVPTADGSKVQLDQFYVKNTDADAATIDPAATPVAASGTDSNKAKTKSINMDSIKAGTPFPAIMTIDMSLIETHAPSEFLQRFDLAKYRRGDLTGF